MCGGVALVSAAIWAFYVTSLPEQNTLLSKAELEYIQQQMELRDGVKIKKIEESVKELEMIEADEQPASTIKTKTSPRLDVLMKEAKLWTRLFLNWPVIGVMLVKWTMRLSTDAQTQYLSNFFNNVHNLTKGDNSMVNCINYAIQGILTYHIVVLVNYCLENRTFNLNKTGIRRLFQCGCSFGMASAYMLVTFDLESLQVSLWAVLLLALTNILQSGADSMMPYDLSPTYSGTIMGVANSFANSAGVILPNIVKAVVGEEVNVLENWRNLFYIVSGLIASGGIVFILLVKAKVQPFDPAYEQSRLKAKQDREARADKRRQLAIEMESIEINGIRPHANPIIKQGWAKKDIDIEKNNNSVGVLAGLSTPEEQKMSQLTFSEWRQTRANEKKTSSA